MIWSMETVGAVSRLFADANIATPYADRVEAVNALRRQAALMLVEMGHPLGVEIHLDDVQMRRQEITKDHAMRNIVPFQAAWRPTTTLVELAHVGEFDGKLMLLGRVGEPLLLPVTASSPPLAFDPGEMATEISPTIATLEFRLDGWNETERRWIYRTPEGP